MVASALVPAAPATRSSTADVFRNGAFVPNDWQILADDAELPADGQVLVPLARALGVLTSGAEGNRPIGVVVGPADKLGDLAPFIDRIAVVAIDFPKYADGRGFSQAARLARLGFTGEVRAIGNVLIDQITYMKRLGFTAFEVKHGVTRRYLEAGRDPAPQIFYQPALAVEAPVGTRPWLRRTVTESVE